MSAAETITAAIEKLERERDEFHADAGWTPHGLPSTLYDTIDAQLAILRAALPYLGFPPSHFQTIRVPALALARAILGEEA